MKIDIECINHNALRLIDEAVCEPIECTDSPQTAIAAINQIRGVLLMAEAMKEALKA